MYFVSKHAKHKIVVQPDDSLPRFGADGRVVHVDVITPLVIAHFRPDRALPDKFRSEAVAYFNAPGRLGNQWMQPGITGLGDDHEGFLGGHYFEGSDPKFKLGILDTDDISQVPAKYKELVERTLLASPALGNTFINFDTKLPPPWKAYTKLRANAEDIAKMLARIEDDEIPVERVIEFEESNDNRKTFLDALEEYQAAQGA